MDRDGDRSAERASVGTVLLPSRAAALELCRQGLEAEGSGPVLLSGAAGSGKTWLCGRLVSQIADGRRWLSVDVAPSAGPAEFAQTLALALGLGWVDDRRARVAVVEALAESSEEGQRWGLIVDEAHNARLDVLEEIRLLSNRLGRDDGFDAILLVGQTHLVRQFATRSLAAFEARLTARVHLRPIDADEARTLLAQRGSREARVLSQVDALHRNAAGNPRRLIQIAESQADRRVVTTQTLPESRPQSDPPRLGTPKPPLRVEEGLIEVGWEGEEESELTAEPEPQVVEASVDLELAKMADPETIHDPYAALQAWAEWSENQGRGQVPAGDLAAIEPDDLTSENSSTRLWVDDPQGFAPYSQLFSRLRSAEAGSR